MKENKVWIDKERVHLETVDGRKGSLLLRAFPRLANATQVQLRNFRLSPSGIHWPDLDEDLSFEGFFEMKEEPNRIAELFRKHPEINVSQFARQHGMNENMLAKYICGYRKPSPEKVKQIEDALHALGRELLNVSLAI